MARITTFGPVDPRALAQLGRCAEEAARAVLCADHHAGYSQPIGGAIGYTRHISPSGVGYDIGCGNKAVLTDLRADQLPRGTIADWMDRIGREVPFGIGRTIARRIDHPVLDAIARAPFRPQRTLAQLAASQLGTVGAGNHYVDLFRDEAGRIWVGVHFGSRGFGHRTASGFLSLARGRAFDAPGSEGGMDASPTLLDVAGELGQEYLAAMELAGAYAHAGRDLVCAQVLEILGARATDEVHNHHNFAWRERHEGIDLWVVRKGCTPAFPGQRGFVGGSMGDISVILEGVAGPLSEEALHTTVHGAGRVMSRTQAAGKSKWVRDPATGRKMPRRVGKGAIDWDATRADLRARGIELRGADADEAPGAYRRLPEVLAHHAGTIRILHTLMPLGVAMAGPDIEDPYRD
ncbi:MAG: RtcB family protein [Chloroflexi bacterium]|nr:RtcB family protein [Chloroflexota bacterium]